MFTVRSSSFNEIYKQLLAALNTSELTRECKPRGITVRELKEPVAYTLENPENCWLTLRGRKLNPFFAAAEVFWILGGRSSLAWIERFNKVMRKFADGDGVLNAPYGERLFKYPYGDKKINQIQIVVDKLRKDPDTRQAVAVIWHPIKDNEKHGDIACNIICHFTIRDDKLHLVTTQRSNDFYLGTPYNSIQFSYLQILVAGELGVELGPRTHVINNLHLYQETYYEDPQCLRNPDFVFIPQKNDWRMNFGFYNTMDQALDAALKMIEEDSLSFPSLPYILPTTSEGWKALFALPVLYAFYKKKEMSREEVLYFFSGHQWQRSEVFTWLVKDFWGVL